MNDEQYKRFRKMNAESIKCLYSKKDKNGGIHFLISGSTGTKYKVSVYNDGRIVCDCPDFTHGSKENECVCKHCLYILYKELGLFKNLEHNFFKRLFLTPDEIQNIQKIYACACKSNLKQKRIY